MILDSFLQGVRRTTLPNGLTLLTREHRRGGVVAINTWVKAGYFHEPDEVAGMAHLFEHMFFKGSKNFPGAEEIAQHVSRLGGMTNAGTIYDSTNYYFVMPREGFVRGVEIQADAILNPLFDPEELRKEAEVVIEESNRKFDNPPAVALERMFETAFTQHRIKRWRIGSNEVLRNIRRDDLLAFFQTLYRPENIIVSIVGDITHEEAIDVVSRTFGELPKGELRKERGPSEPPQTEFRFAGSTADVRQSLSVFGWHTPGEGSGDEEALDVLSSILGSGRSSRFYREAVGPGRANSVVAFNSVYEDVGIFSVRASYEDPNLEEVERRVIGEIERMKRFGPTPYEMQLAKNRIESSFVFELEEVLGQAQTLAYYESRGSYEDVGGHIEKLETLTAADIRDVAARYLDFSNLTLYHYRPNGSTLTTRDAALGRLQEAARAQVDAPEAVEIPELPVTVLEPRNDKPLQRFVLSNGATLFVKENSGVPAVSTTVCFKGGRIFEHSTNAGITQLMARSMRRGTSRRTGPEIDREIEFLGTQIGITIEEDYFSFGVEVLTRYFKAGVEVLADVVLDPVFPRAGVIEEQHLQTASIRRSLDSSGERPFQLLFDALYGNHPYGLPDAGYVSSVEKLDRDMLALWWEDNVVADGAIIVVVGDVEARDVLNLMEYHFGKLRKSVALRPPVPDFMPPSSPLEVVETRDRKQTAVAVAWPTVPPQHPDWPALRLLQDVVSGLAGTFFAELRGKRSLAYTVYAGDSSRETAGAFVGYIASEASKEKEAREGLVGEIRKLESTGIEEAEVARARSYIAGATRIRLQTNGAVAHDLAQNYLYGLGLDFTERFLDRIGTLGVEQLRAVAKKYLSHDNYVVATLRGRS